MTMEEVIAEMRLELTGNVLETELDDKTFEQIVNKAIRELQRYMDSTKFKTIPFAKCIDCKDSDISSVSRVCRAQIYGGQDFKGGSIDPFYAQAFMIFSNQGALYNYTDYVAKFGAWNTLLQMRNTISTDLQFVWDSFEQKLYINTLDMPEFITLEYVPVIKDVDEIKSPYWIDNLIRYSVGLAKIYVGRIRTRYELANNQWTGDGNIILEEGNAEIKELREKLQINSQLTYVYD